MSLAALSPSMEAGLRAEAKLAEGAGKIPTLVARRLAALPPTLLDFRPAPPAADRAAWTALPEMVRARLVARGEAALESEWPALSARAYMSYCRDGDRDGFETRYMTRRRMLNALALAECAEGRGRFLEAIADALWAICEESGWQLPAHNSHVRGGSRAALPDTAAPVIDLFAAETGAQLAVLATLLGAELAEIAPDLARRLDREVEARIVTPYLGRHFWWMGNGDEPMNNWTAWCTQNVLLAVFCRPTTQAIRRAVAHKAAASLDAFLKDYGADGACEEGALYFRHAGLCLFNAISVLDAAAPGVFAPLWREPKIRNIADYILNAHVDGDWYFNFADCAARAGRCGAREFLFGLAVGSDALADFAARDWAEDAAPDLPEEVNLFYRLQAAFTAPALAARPGVRAERRDVFYPSIGLMIARDDRFALAVKAGDNGDSHNHNDVGSFILYKDAQPFLIDVGVETYTAQTFSQRRYEIWTMQSAFHNLPTFGGVMQREGEAFAARDVEVCFAADEARIAMELAGAWPEEAGVASYRRSVRLVKGQGVEVEDCFDGARPAELSLMFASRPRVGDGVFSVEGLGEVRLEGAGAARLEEIAIADARLRQVWGDQLYRVLVPIAAPRLVLRIR
jgi:hypothetical protein